MFMKTSRILTNFNGLSEVDLQERTNTVLVSMTGNTNFVTPDPTLDSLSDANTAYRGVYAQVMAGNKMLISLKNDNKAVVVGILQNLAAYVMYISKGVRAIQATSGFELSKEPTPLPPLTQPAVTVANGVNTGELEISTGRMPAAISYQYWYAVAVTGGAQPVWQMASSSKMKLLITGLTSCTNYLCKVAVVGAKNQIVYSDIVSRVVL
jgi:hypothetical protein